MTKTGYDGLENVTYEQVYEVFPEATLVIFFGGYMSGSFTYDGMTASSYVMNDSAVTMVMEWKGDYYDFYYESKGKFLNVYKVRNADDYMQHLTKKGIKEDSENGYFCLNDLLLAKTQISIEDFTHTSLMLRDGD